MLIVECERKIRNFGTETGLKNCNKDCHFLFMFNID